MRIVDDVAALDLPSLVRDGDTVVCAQGLAEPSVLLDELLARRAEIGRFTLLIGPSFAGTFRPEQADRVTFRSWCGTGGNAALSAAGCLDVVPVHYSAMPGLYAAGTMPCDVALLTVGEADESGRFNLGLTNDYVLAAARRARRVVLEIRAGVPWVFGAELPADIMPDAAVRTNRPLPLQPRPDLASASEPERAIARHAASLVPDGACLAVGIGRMPDLVLAALRDHRDLGIHSGAIGDAVADLMEAGVVTNARKPVEPGVTVANILNGTRRLLDFAHRNEAIRLRPPAVTHDVGVLRSIPRYTAITGAVEIDLGGQVNAEEFERRYVGAVGGQLDYMRGASGSEGGRSVTLLPSTARAGRASRILPRLQAGIVTTPRSDVDAVVTEWGIAHLRGRSLAERAAALIDVAHPDFREELRRSFRQAGA